MRRNEGLSKKERKWYHRWSRKEINAVTLGGPVVLFFAMLGIIYLIFDHWKALAIIGFMIWYIFPPFGKETIIPMAVIANDINFITISLAIAFMDMVMAMIIVFNFGFIKKFPGIGPWIIRFEKNNRKALDESRLFRDLAFLGIILFVMVPFQGSGGVMASIIGRLIGMEPRRIFTAITAGAITGCLAIGYLADTIGQAAFSFLDTTEAKVIAILIFGIVGGLVFHLIRRFRAQLKAKKEEPRNRTSTEEE
jgi:uncharacterized membrane protein